MANKFKVGDIIRIKDKTDPSYPHNFFYEVLSNDEMYVLQSFKKGTIYESPELLDIAKQIRYNNPTNFINECYRLVTKTELVLYGRKIVQKEP